MSWPSRRCASWLPVLLAGTVAACGFHPLYSRGQRGELDAELSAIRVAPVPERLGQMIVISLRDGFDPAGATPAPRYALTITLSTSLSDFAIRKDGTASRELYNAVASFTLQDIESQKAIFTGSARAYDSYDIGANPYTTIVANSDADRRAAISISEQIRTQIAVFMRSRRSS